MFVKSFEDLDLICKREAKLVQRFSFQKTMAESENSNGNRRS